MTTYYIWRYKCVTENTIVREILKSTDSPPTTCVNDRVGHTINLTSLTREKELSDNMVTIKEEYIPTGGKWEAESFFLNGTTGPSVTVKNFIWDNPISVLEMQFYPEALNRYDAVQLEVIPPDIGYGEGVIGILSDVAATGATGIKVDPTIIDNVLIADNISLKMGDLEQDLGNIIFIDKTNNVIFCKNAAQYEFSNPTFVKFKRYVLERFVLGPVQRYPLGDGKIGGSYVPKGYIVRASYINNGGGPKELYCIIEYLE